MTYPSNQVTVEAYARPVWEALGSFYSQFSEDKEFYRTLCETVVQGFSMPWTLLERQRSIVNPEGNPSAYSWPALRMVFNYSESRLKDNGSRCVALPGGITSVRFLKDKFINETYAITRGVDFEIEEWDGKTWLVFTGDPFLGSRFEINSTLNEANEISDQELVAWAVSASIDLWPLERQWAVWLKMKLRDESSAVAVQEAVKSFATGPAFAHLAIGAGRAYGHPVCEKDGEEVELITTDFRGKLVVTDQSAYRFPADATIIVGEGDVLNYCQPISSGVLWYDPSLGEFPDLPGWAIDKNELGANYTGPLLFPNEEKDVTVTSVADRTKIQVGLGGAEQDQETFWAEAHTRGIAGGTTLANYYDTRPNPVGEPEASALPTTLNPYQLLANEAFRYGAIICVLDYGQSLNPAGASFLSAWKKAMPSHQAIKSFVMFSGDVGVAASYTSGGDPYIGFGFSGSVGYYGIGPYSSAGGNPSIITQEVA